MVLAQPEAPALVEVGIEQCADSSRARSALRAGLEQAQAPGGAWRVTVTVQGRPSGTVRLTAEVRDELGAVRAERELQGRASDCNALVRGATVWVLLTLDAERERAAEGEAAQPSPSTSPEAPVVAWPAPAVEPVENLEQEVFLAHADGHGTVEVGGGGFAMGGLGTGGVTGAHLFGIIEAGQGWYVRPSVAGGRSLEAVGSQQTLATVGVVRADVCKRVPGNYFERRGMQLDLCSGLEGGDIVFDTAQGSTERGAPPAVGSSAYASVGPAVGIRGEMASNLSVHLRGEGGYNVVRNRVYDAQGNSFGPAAWSARAEVALSWRLR